NNLRLFEDPTVVARTLAPWARATHIKDLGAMTGDPKQFFFWPSMPLGEGLVDLPTILGILRAAKYQGLLAIEFDFLHPDRGDESRALSKSVRYLRDLVNQTTAIRSG